MASPTERRPACAARAVTEAPSAADDAGRLDAPGTVEASAARDETPAAPDTPFHATVTGGLMVDAGEWSAIWKRSTSRATGSAGE